PDWLHNDYLVALLLIVAMCFVVGVAVRTKMGRALSDRLERSVLGKIPGYTLVRSLTQQLVGEGRENAWTPALAEIEEALVPAFIIEALDDGRYTVFVPSVPTPFAGTVYILTKERVHPVNASFLQTCKTLAQWGAGSKDLVAAMKSKHAA